MRVRPPLLSGESYGEAIPGLDVRYGLINFDADGHERRESDGLMSEKLIASASQEPITNVFFFCHGWKGDLPEAREQYNRWIGAR